MGYYVLLNSLLFAHMTASPVSISSYTAPPYLQSQIWLSLRFMNHEMTLKEVLQHNNHCRRFAR